ncbi:alpha/beta fold hydrolase [Paraferrimonas sp. SM1919]|uniref:alpha/beta fold hydrolase n=1 Tax=Paraferrimonas sp. SM1919 TaxID=2662263 RepID=UPI0013CFF781|nr:alpha/beta fold hydrolase [Paraferrimonas sp. SM1919]
MTDLFLGYQNKISAQQLQQFQQGLIEGNFSNSIGKRINYCYYPLANAKATVVISSGRVEGYLKYLEVIYDFHQQGYQVFAIDHLGQGLSERLLADSHKGHINDFNQFTDDFSLWLNKIVQPKCQGTLLLLGHSMGGAIAIDYMLKYPQDFAAAALCAPMLGIKLPAPKALVKLLLAVLLKLGLKNKYILGGGKYDPEPFAGNELTGDAKRYQWFRELYLEHPNMQLGSPTNGWLDQAFKACSNNLSAASQLSVPTLIIQAGADNIVDNYSQNRFTCHAPHCQLLKIDNAKHELLLESDSIRNPTLEAIFREFQKYC